MLLALPLAASICAQTNEVDPCTLIDKAALTKIFGEIKEGPKAKEGLMKEKQCEWTNMSGSWVTASVYTAERWGLKKGSGNNPVEVKDLGEEAFTDKRGTDSEIYIRKGKSMLEVRTSAGSDVARKVAESVITKLP
jgi:hypothetical protein